MKTTLKTFVVLSPSLLSTPPGGGEGGEAVTYSDVINIELPNWGGLG